jgi:hypothetical protein
MSKQEAAPSETEAAVAERLQAMFDDVAAQPTPSWLMDLVEALEEKRLYREKASEET